MTDALLVVHDGKTVLERYERGYKADSRHLLWSISKSVTATIIGAALQKGLLKKDDSICKGTALKVDGCKVTVDDLLNWSSGFQWFEDYEEAKDRTKSSVIQMLVGDGFEDMFGFVLKHPLRWPAGSRYSYSTGDSTALMGVLKNIVNNKDRYDRLPWDLVFDKMGMKNVTFEQDGSGTFVGGAWAYMTAHDLARLGQLYVDNGKLNDDQILPAGWVAQVTTPSKGFLAARDGEGSSIPLRQFWRPVQALRGVLPADTFTADGHWGQVLVVIPSLKLVAVRFGDDRERHFDINRFAQFLVATVHPGPLKPFVEVSALPVAAVSSETIDYHQSLMAIGSRYIARLFCSCREVTGQSKDFCEHFTQVSPDVFQVRPGTEPKSYVASIARVLWSAEARWSNDHVGCRFLSQ